jgi:hypothetical protein
MNLEPLTLSKTDRLIDKPVSRWRLLKHYGPQVLRQLPGAIYRGVSQVLRKICQGVVEYWVVLTILTFFGGTTFICWRTYSNTLKEQAEKERQEKDAAALKSLEAERKEKADRSTVDANAIRAHEYMTKWQAAFLGDAEAVCFDTYNKDDLFYHVVCHIGPKGKLPEKSVHCSQLGCDLTKL